MPPGEPGSAIALGINNRGQVVGFYGPPRHPGDLPPLFGWNGFIYDNGVATNLNSLIDPACGWHVENAWAINDLGQIVVTASNWWIDNHGKPAGPGAVGHLRSAAPPAHPGSLKTFPLSREGASKPGKQPGHLWAALGAPLLRIPNGSQTPLDGFARFGVGRAEAVGCDNVGDGQVVPRGPFCPLAGILRQAIPLALSAESICYGCKWSAKYVRSPSLANSRRSPSWEITNARLFGTALQRLYADRCRWPRG